MLEPRKLHSGANLRLPVKVSDVRLALTDNVGGINKGRRLKGAFGAISSILFLFLDEARDWLEIGSVVLAQNFFTEFFASQHGAFIY